MKCWSQVIELSLKAHKSSITCGPEDCRHLWWRWVQVGSPLWWQCANRPRHSACLQGAPSFGSGTSQPEIFYLILCENKFFFYLNHCLCFKKLHTYSKIRKNYRYTFSRFNLSALKNFPTNTITALPHLSKPEWYRHRNWSISVKSSLLALRNHLSYLYNKHRRYYNNGNQLFSLYISSLTSHQTRH